MAGADPSVRSLVLDPAFGTAARVAALFGILNGLLHLAVNFYPEMTGGWDAVAGLTITGLLFVDFGWLAFRNRRWAKVAVVILAVISGCLLAAIPQDPASAVVPAGWRNIVVAIDLLITVMMGVHLWRLFRLKEVRNSSSH